MNATLRKCLLATVLGMALPLSSLGQSAVDLYPAKPVQVVLSYPPGGTTDLEARLYTAKLTENLGRPFIMDYKPGAGETIGTGYVAKAAPDGYTLLIVTSGFSVNPAFYKNLPYDPIKDFAPVSMMSKRTTLLVVHPSLPVKNLAEYLAYAKANPGKINFATNGAGGITHLTGAWLHNVTKTSVTFVHYKGSAELQVDLVAGRTNATAATFRQLNLVKEGKLRALGTATLERSPMLPDMPTVAEQGVPGYEYSSWLGIVVPGRTPLPLVNKLSAEIRKAAQAPEVTKRLADDGTIVVAYGPEQFGKHIAAEIARWNKVVADTGIKLE